MGELLDWNDMMTISTFFSWDEQLFFSLLVEWRIRRTRFDWIDDGDNMMTLHTHFFLGRTVFFSE